ncbi:MAG TPA: hypothetical protein VJR89_06695 [Polyangiales bacterium]|nr:hypothetical protein [Polyangiales bacterium]
MNVYARLSVAAALSSAACLVDNRFEDVPKSICASREIWTYEDKDSPLMNPGRSCVQCHADTDDPAHAPLYSVAGTVMQAKHDSDDCRGVAGMTVILTDARGEEWTMTANSAGNFWLDPDAEVAMPYTARVVDAGGRERSKQTPVSDGDCASCHTREGANGAAGRILPPD